jgi:hypothetical protein
MFGGIQIELPKETLDLINTIANQVGSTDYIKTPQFPKRQMPVGGINGLKHGVGQGNLHHHKRAKNKEINDDDWDAIRNFQATDIKKAREGLELSIDNIRKNLNKITSKTYTKMVGEIMTEVAKICESENDLTKIGEFIFTTASSNIVFSSLYSKLYKELMDKYEVFKSIFKVHFDKITETFTAIEYYDANENYDKFCENNVKNSNRRAMCMFYVNLMKENIISKDEIVNIIKNLIKYFNSQVREDNKKEIADELSELIYIFITNSNSDLEDEDDWDDIVSQVEIISKYKVKDFPSITNKAIFKFMDILDEI